jgi:hypothetical protein
MMSEVGGDVFELDVIDGTNPGGANTSHTIAVDLLKRLLDAVPTRASRGEYLDAAIEDNVLGRATAEGRRRTVRYLRELYLLDPHRILFRALRDLWGEDADAQPLLAGLASFARDSVFRASACAVLPVEPGIGVSSEDLTEAVTTAFPGVYNVSTADKIGRNTGSSWTQSGHLVGRSRKVRRRVDLRPASAAYALLFGHLEGLRGQALFETSWTQFLGATPHDMHGLADLAARRGYLELKSSGGVVEIGFRHLLRPMEGGRHE